MTKIHEHEDSSVKQRALTFVSIRQTIQSMQYIAKISLKLLILKETIHKTKRLSCQFDKEL